MSSDFFKFQSYNLKPEDTIIFKHSDMHEYLPDFELLNEKRKELMLEGHNIYPYIGGYKAIINAIKFFGYDNLNIIEYWRNINEYDSEYGKIYRTYVYSLKDRKCLSTKRKPISLDTKNFKKLNTISLSYNINHPESVGGEKYDEYGLPNVIEDFDKDKRDDFVLTIEEALIKLFALKKKLNDEFMPGSSKITDIVGEGNYFGINLIGNNPQISTVNYIESKGEVDFTVFPSKYCYITENEDFARYIAERKDLHVDETIGGLGDRTIEEISKFYVDSDSDSDRIDEIDTGSISDIINDLIINDNNIVCDFYEEYYNITYDNKFGDAKKCGLREIPEPRNVYKDAISGEMIPNISICAKVILKGNFSENIDNTSIVEWKISHSDPAKKWSMIYMGSVKTFGDVFVQLPYLGNYDVEMTVWDVYNHRCNKSIKNAIIVEPYNIDIRGFYYDARPLPNELKYDLMVPQEYDENVKKEYRYYLWTQEGVDGIKKGIVSYKRKSSEITISDIFGVVDNIVCEDYNSDFNYFDCLKNIRNINEENWISIVNSEEDDILKISWMKSDKNSDGGNDIYYGVDTFNFECELTDVPFDENDSYVPEWNSDALYHVIKKNVDKMYSCALREHLNVDCENTSMRNYRPDGSVNFEGPYYKYDVDTILYKIGKGYKEYDHLNGQIINLEHGNHYKYVRYINNAVNIKPLTWVLLGFDQTRITGRIIDGEYPKWTLTMVGNTLDPDETMRNDIDITTHKGLYLTYLFENEGVYKVKLELMDINGNKYNIEKSIIIVDKDANYEMYHTLNDEYNKYLEAKKERNLIYLN